MSPNSVAPLGEGAKNQIDGLTDNIGALGKRATHAPLF
jgi:hypothetical protein